jgi:hypothetical protein
MRRPAPSTAEPGNVREPDPASATAREQSVSKIRVMILGADCPRYLCRSVAEYVRSRDELKLIGEAAGPLDLLVRLRRRRERTKGDPRSRHSRADVVLLLGESIDRTPGICTHLLAEYPDLLVLALPQTGAVGVAYRRAVTRTPVPLNRDDSLLRAILADE